MADEVYLHIGAPKTGTSYVQLMLWKNQQVLEDQGIFLPLGRRRAHFDAVADLRGGIWADGPLTATWEELAQEIRERPGVAVVSEELLCGTPADQVQRLAESLAPVPVHVVLGVRDLGRQVPAEWQQAIRARSATRYGEWVDLLHDQDRPFWQIQDPVRVLSRWEQALEPGRFHVLTVPPSGGPPIELWERFCRLIGADPSPTKPLEGKQNASLGVVQAEYLRRFNEQLGSRFPMRHAYISMVRDYVMRPGLIGASGAIRIGVPAEHHEWITRRSTEMVTSLEELGDRVDVVGSAAELHAEIESAQLSPDEVTESQLLAVATEAQIAQLEAMERELERRSRVAARLRKRLRAQRCEVERLTREVEELRAAAVSPPVGSRVRKLATDTVRRVVRR